MKMKKVVPLLAVFLIFVVVTTGFMVFIEPADIDKTAQVTQYIPDSGFSANADAKNRHETDNTRLASTTRFPVPENRQVDLNDVAVYNGIISEISVSPTVITFDYNHDGIADVRKTVLFFNIG
jgi:predicted PurR-regulated permease PerM